MTELRSPLQAHIVQLLVQAGETVQQGQVLLVLEAMKMEHEICAPGSGQVREIFCAAGETVQAGDVLMLGTDVLANGQRPRTRAGDTVCLTVPGFAPWVQTVQGEAP